MIAASARTSGTSAPFSSVLNLGCWASTRALACAAARARAALSRRDCAVLPEEVFLAFVARGVVAAFEVVPVFGAAEDLLVVEDDSAGSAATTTQVAKQISLAVLNSPFRITDNPLRDSLLEVV